MALYKFQCSSLNTEHTKVFHSYARICPICGELGESEKLPEKETEEKTVESKTAERIRNQVIGFQ